MYSKTITNKDQVRQKMRMVVNFEHKRIQLQIILNLNDGLN